MNPTPTPKTLDEVLKGTTLVIGVLIPGKKTQRIDCTSDVHRAIREALSAAREATKIDCDCKPDDHCGASCQKTNVDAAWNAFLN